MVFGGANNGVDAMMSFRVGALIYRLVLTEVPPLLRGMPCVALVDYVEQRIEVDRSVCGPRRYQAVFHELMHAWLHHFATPTEQEEALCELAAHAALAFADDLEHQGGRQRLEWLGAPGPRLVVARECRDAGFSLREMVLETAGARVG